MTKVIRIKGTEVRVKDSQLTVHRTAPDPSLPVKVEINDVLSKLLPTGAKYFEDLVTTLSVISSVRGRDLGTTTSIDDEQLLALSKIIEQSIDSSDLLSRVFEKALTDDPSVSEQVAKELARAVIDTLNSSESISREPSKFITDSGALNDSLVKLFNKSLSSSVTATDDFDGEALVDDDQTISFVKSVSDVTYPSDQISITAVFNRFFLEDVYSSDSVGKELLKVALEAVASNDQHQLDFAKFVLDTAIIAESILKTFGRLLSDVVTTAFLVERSFQKVLSSDSSASDIALKSFDKGIQDAQIADDVSWRDASKVLQDSVSPSHTLSKILLRNIADIVYVTTDFPELLIGTFESYETSASITDQLGLNSDKSLTEMLGSAESAELFKSSYFSSDYMSEKYSGTLHYF